MRQKAFEKALEARMEECVPPYRGWGWRIYKKDSDLSPLMIKTTVPSE